MDKVNEGDTDLAVKIVNDQYKCVVQGMMSGDSKMENKYWA